MLPTNKHNISCTNIVSAVRKIQVKQRFSGFGLNVVQHIPSEKAGKLSRGYTTGEKNLKL